LNDYSFERAGNEFYRGGEPDRAIEQYRKALELNPENVHVHQRLGFLLYHVNHQFEEGLAHTREALRLDPRNAFAHSDLGVALLRQNQPDLALAHLQTASATLPRSLESQYQPRVLRYHLGQAAMQLRQFTNAAKHLKEAVRLDPDYAEAHYLLALASICQGHLDEALQHHARAVALRPGIDTSLVLHELFAENYARTGQTAEAVRSAEHALHLAQRAGNEAATRRIANQLERLNAGR
jgi:tetratricopeptide (TPR) repeat protein